jgi:hypothetical protein
MKIFTLETKKHMVVWSLLFSTILNWIFYIKPVDVFSFYYQANSKFGWPFSYSVIFTDDNRRQLFGNVWETRIENFVFWFIVPIIVLSIIRRFRNKTP